MRLNRDDERNRVLGCWLGKNVGGTLGAPFEWKRQVNHVTFTVEMDYGDARVIRSGEPKTVRVHIDNTCKIEANLSLH